MPLHINLRNRHKNSRVYLNQIEDKIREDAEELGEDYGGEEEVGEVFPGAEDLD